MEPANFGHALLVNKKQAASLLGISKRMIEKMVRLRKLEAVKIGAKTMFRREDIEFLAMKPSQRKALEKDCTTSVQ